MSVRAFAFGTVDHPLAESEVRVIPKNHGIRRVAGVTADTSNGLRQRQK